MKKYRIRVGQNVYMTYINRERALKDLQENPESSMEEYHMWSYYGKRPGYIPDVICIEGEDFIQAVGEEVPKIIKNTFGAVIGYKLHKATLKRIGKLSVQLRVVYQKEGKLNVLEDEMIVKTITLDHVTSEEFGDSYEFEFK